MLQMNENQKFYSVFIYCITFIQFDANAFVNRKIVKFVIQNKQNLSKYLNRDFDNKKQNMLSYYTDIIAQDNSLVKLEFNMIDVRSRNIKFINDIDTKLMFISRLYLDHNSLKSLDGIWQFKNLQEFQFNFNYVEGLDQFIKINNPFFMKNLSYIGNPVQKKVSKTWLKKNGFRNLQSLNEIQQIGKEVHCCINIRNSSNQQYYKERLSQLMARQFQLSADTPYKTIQRQESHFSPSSLKKTRQIGRIYKNKFSQQKSRQFNFQEQKSPQFYRTINRSQISKLANMLNCSDNSITQRFNYQNNITDPHSNQITRRGYNIFSNQKLKKRKDHYSNEYHENSGNVFINLNELQKHVSRVVEKQLQQQTGDSSGNFYRKNRSRKKQFQQQQYQNYSNELLQIKQVNPFQLNAFEEVNEQESDHEIFQNDQAFQKKEDNSQQQLSALSLKNKQLWQAVNQVAIAFYYKNLKEKAFQSLKKLQQQQRVLKNHKNKNKQVEMAQNNQKLRWAWVKLRLFTTNKKIISSYSSWGINQII